MFWFFQQITLISPALIIHGHLMIIQECTNVLDRRKKRLIDVNAECRHLKKLTCKGTFRQMLSEFIDRSSQCLAYIQSCWFFQHSFVICTLPCCPSPHFSGSTSPPPFPRGNKCTRWGGGGRICGFVGHHILQEFYTLYLTTVRTCKMSRPPPNKNLGGEGDSDR